MYKNIIFSDLLKFYFNLFYKIFNQLSYTVWLCIKYSFLSLIRATNLNINYEHMYPEKIYNSMSLTLDNGPPGCKMSFHRHHYKTINSWKWLFPTESFVVMAQEFHLFLYHGTTIHVHAIHATNTIYVGDIIRKHIARPTVWRACRHMGMRSTTGTIHNQQLVQSIFHCVSQADWREKKPFYRSGTNQP